MEQKTNLKKDKNERSENERNENERSENKKSENERNENERNENEKNCVKCMEHTKQSEQTKQEERVKQSEQIKQVEQIEQIEQIVHRIKMDREKFMEIQIPDEGIVRMKDAIERAKNKKKGIRQMRRRIYGASIAAAFAVICLIPNCSRASAQALQELPVLGRFFEVITIRDYHFDDGYSTANIEIPKLADESPDGDASSGHSAAADINKSVEEYTDEILERFKENQEIIGDQGHQSLDISYNVLTDTDDWFTLEIIVDEVQASGYEYKRYYHIDKSTGKIASLKDLFVPESNYLEIISSYILQQMKKYNKESEAGEVYWIGDSQVGHGYEGISEDQNFYLNRNNNLVIVFDEYDVAPGYMGTPEFVIPQKLIADLRRF